VNRSTLAALAALLLLTQAGCATSYLIGVTDDDRRTAPTGRTHDVRRVVSAAVGSDGRLDVRVRYDDDQVRAYAAGLDAEPAGELVVPGSDRHAPSVLAERADPGASLERIAAHRPVALAVQPPLGPGHGPRAWWSARDDGSVALAVERGGRVTWVRIPARPELASVYDPWPMVGRVAGLPVAVAWDVATLPLQPLFLWGFGPLLLFELGPI